MIKEYHRPAKLDEALELLARKSPPTRPLGGGTVLNAPSSEEVAVVDLKSLGLDKIKKKGKLLQIGATATLESLLAAKDIPAALAAAIRHEANYTLRQTATVAGCLVAADGRSPFATVMLALDAALTLQPGDENLGYGDLLPLRSEKLAGRLITQVDIPIQVQLAYEFVARSPADLPIVALALAQWPSGRTRVAVGGFGAQPRLALDGQEPSGVEEAVANALSDSADQWASADYRLDVGSRLVGRALAVVEKTS
jgi:CO/xanthine dehydrogenase FAD-binding subunit